MTLHKSKDPRADMCPVRDVIDRLANRWTILILHELEGGTLRFSQLNARIEDVSRRMLAQTLRNLEQDGLVTRTIFPTVPPRVDYTLTPLGQSLLEPMHGLIRWARKNHEAVRSARAAQNERKATPD